MKKFYEFERFDVEYFGLIFRLNKAAAPQPSSTPGSKIPTPSNKNQQKF